jgi:hypothetical protein
MKTEEALRMTTRKRRGMTTGKCAKERQQEKRRNSTRRTS